MPDEIKTSNVTRRQLFRWLAWFALANAIVLGLISLRYLDGGIGGLTPVAWVYLFSIYVSHHSWLALLPLFVVLTPVILLKPSFGWTRAMAVTVMAALIAVIMLDSLLWSQSRFHINMLTLKILGSSSFIFVVVMFFIALLFETLLSSRVWAWVSNSPSRGGRLLGWVLAVCFLVAQAIYAWADATYL